MERNQPWASRWALVVTRESGTGATDRTVRHDRRPRSRWTRCTRGHDAEPRHEVSL